MGDRDGLAGINHGESGLVERVNVNGELLK